MSPPVFLLGVQLALLLLGGALVAWLGLGVLAAPDPFRDGVLGLGLFLLLQGLEALFARLFPRSFRSAEALHRELGRLLRRSGLGPREALLLSLLSALGEEVFFRGAVQGLLVRHLGAWGVGAQALVFALFHPAPRSALAYTLFTGVAGLLFGLAFLLSGSLVPGILAHFLHNAKSFAELLGSGE
ncbi:CPBP family intramembrane glutamic endopeptidase [Thermus filiformis]|uniref:CAAX protease n=1 Tax=Thermus filiformis TaxID=276 RepID=A0A0A2WTK2_THEFI|nr:CPBP family intramembrane glutamic endopeptidase [Thermus filiformis]KGQ23123.1 CAAX protease [Thermus filiformis]